MSTLFNSICRNLRVDRWVRHIHFFYLPLLVLLSRGIVDPYLPLLKLLLSSIFIMLSISAAGSCDAFFDRNEDLLCGMSVWMRNPYLAKEISDSDILRGTITLYVQSIVFSFVLACWLNPNILLFAAISAMLSWIYSDNLFAKRIIRFRLKDHYILEVLGLGIGYFFLFLACWLIFLPFMGYTLPIGFLVSTQNIARIVEKDIVQMPKDDLAGNRTFPVVYGVNKSRHLLASLQFLSYCLVIGFVICGYLPKNCLFVLITSLAYILRPLNLRSNRIGLVASYLKYLNPFFLVLGVGILISR